MYCLISTTPRASAAVEYRRDAQASQKRDKSCALGRHRRILRMLLQQASNTINNVEQLFGATVVKGLRLCGPYAKSGFKCQIPQFEPLQDQIARPSRIKFVLPLGSKERSAITCALHLRISRQRYLLSIRNKRISIYFPSGRWCELLCQMHFDRTSHAEDDMVK